MSLVIPVWEMDVDQYWMSWPSSWHSCFVFCRSRVQILARRPAILTEVCRGFPQSSLDKFRDNALN
jgi:hypothetical protein